MSFEEIVGRGVLRFALHRLVDCVLPGAGMVLDAVGAAGDAADVLEMCSAAKNVHDACSMAQAAAGAARAAGHIGHNLATGRRVTGAMLGRLAVQAAGENCSDDEDRGLMCDEVVYFLHLLRL